MKRRHRIIVATVLGATIVAGAAFGAAAGLTRSGSHDAPAALEDQSLAASHAPAGALDLASAVNRWEQEAEAAGHEGPGRAVIGKTSQLLKDVGSERDELNAFPTDSGLVCFELRAAGTCGELEPAGVTYAILTTPTSSRIYGVASDWVTRVQVDVNGRIHDAILRNNAYYYELERGTPRNAVNGLVATSNDGSKRVLPIRLN